MVIQCIVLNIFIFYFTVLVYIYVFGTEFYKSSLRQLKLSAPCAS
jgi:hypothetical protein